MDGASGGEVWQGRLCQGTFEPHRFLAGSAPGGGTPCAKALGWRGGHCTCAGALEGLKECCRVHVYVETLEAGERVAPGGALLKSKQEVVVAWTQCGREGKRRAPKQKRECFP